MKVSPYWAFLRVSIMKQDAASYTDGQRKVACRYAQLALRHFSKSVPSGEMLYDVAKSYLQEASKERFWREE